MTLGLERNLSSGPQCRLQAGKDTAHEANPTTEFVLSLTRCREKRAQVFEGLNLFLEYDTDVDGVLCPETWLR